MSAGIESAGSFRFSCDFQGFPADTLKHAAENDVMQWRDREPIEQPRQTARMEECALL